MDHCHGHRRTSRKLLLIDGGGVLKAFYSHHCISQRVVRTSLVKQLKPLGPIASRGGPAPVFLRKPIATCDFQGEGPDPLSPPLDPLMQARLSRCDKSLKCDR